MIPQRTFGLRSERLRENSAPKSNSALLAHWLKFPVKFSDQPSLKEKTSVQSFIDDGLLSSGATEVFTPFEVENNYTNESLEVEEPLQAEVYLKDFLAKDTVRDEFNTYLKDVWKPWLKKRKIRSPKHCFVFQSIHAGINSFRAI